MHSRTGPRRFARAVNRLHALGGSKWELQIKGRQLARAGADVIEMTLGEPDIDFPSDLIESLRDGLDRRRTRYAEARGEQSLLDALSSYYTRTAGRPFSPSNFLCFPGTQTALFAVVMALVEAGDEVLVGDPMYATYEGVIGAVGGVIRPVPLRPEHDFRMQKEDLHREVTKRCRVILLTTPHNPTGNVLSREEIEAISEIAEEHDLWVVSDEVYAELVFDGCRFCSVAAS